MKQTEKNVIKTSNTNKSKSALKSNVRKHIRTFNVQSSGIKPYPSNNILKPIKNQRKKKRGDFYKRFYIVITRHSYCATIFLTGILEH